MNAEFKSLADRYGSLRPEQPALGEAIHELYHEYVRRREMSFLDAAAAAAGLGAVFTDNIDLDSVTPAMADAWELAYATVDLASLAARSAEEIKGYLPAWKGKYFEVLVRDRLNAGEAVGQVQLGGGQYAELAEDVSQPGWDLMILNSDGTVAESLQLKATEDLSYIRQALERYPDIEIVATDEAAGLIENVFASGISDASLTDRILAPMEALIDSPLEDIIESVLPHLPFVLIYVSEGRHVLMGRRSFDEAMSNILARLVKTGAAMLAGSAIVLLEGGLLALPVTFLVRLGVDRVQIASRVQRRIEEGIAHTSEILPVYAVA